MKEKIIIVLVKLWAALVIIAIIAFLYSTFAGIWGYNPTKVEYLNLKVCGSGLAFLLISAAIQRELEDNEYL